MVCFLVSFGIGFFIGLAFGAGVFMAACTLCGVRTPEFGNAYFIMFCTYFTSTLVSGLFLLMGIAIAPAEPEKAVFVWGAFLLFAAPINLIIGAAIVQLMLPTTFFRAVVIWGMEIFLVFILSFLWGVSMNPNPQPKAGLDRPAEHPAAVASLQTAQINRWRI